LHGEEEQAPTTRLNNNTKEKRRKKTYKGNKNRSEKTWIGINI
jgi:hypothetical protein